MLADLFLDLYPVWTTAIMSVGWHWWLAYRRDNS